ncbi:helix-turn-helix domain-containing protein [Actinomadura barringtoniae]|uniref:Helix-turn-helix domain-containing protein n=1 Tax=Actinomadura barringtoniae TaxID=1427535 RepID=A0A939PMN0_9ACTN|nr:helix-turn-helix domain-containing protein [Actinomadura barringtoniae]MBO2452699.1 helix-turn-helix domain-containing protein [Actinomadura barringtoniae]
MTSTGFEVFAAAYGSDDAPDVSLRVVVVVFDGVSLGSMSFSLGVFDVAASYGGLPGLAPRIVAGEPGTSLEGGGLSVEVPYDLEAIRTAELVIVPTLPQPTAEAPPEPVLEALRTAHARGSRVAGLCNGTFVLAAAGLLDGRSATTHWAVADRLRERHPKVNVDASILYIDDGDVMTAGGAAAGMDLGLHVLRATVGAEIANRLAKAMVLPPHRPGGQAQFVESPMPVMDAGDPVAETIQWAYSRLDTALPVDVLAERAHMSRRNYDRRFREITGSTPAAWLTHQRVIRAQQLLEADELSVDAIARQCGFSSAAALRPHFRRVVGVAPNAYRDSFSRRAAPCSDAR